MPTNGEESSSPAKKGILGLPQAVTEILGYATFAYAVGFLTLLANTAHYGLPVLEFARPLNLWIGVFPTIVIVGSLAILRKWRRLNPEGIRIRLFDVTNDVLAASILIAMPIGLAFFLLKITIQSLLVGTPAPHPSPGPLFGAKGVAVGHWMETHQQLLTWTVSVLTALAFAIFLPSTGTPNASIWRKQFWTESLRHNVDFWIGFWRTGSHRLLRYAVAVSALAVLSIYTWQVFPRLPQRYGFGRPATVQLLVDTQMLPLVPANEATDASSGNHVYLSAPVELIFIADKEYVLRCPSGNQNKIVTIESSSVKGIVWQNATN